MYIDTAVSKRGDKVYTRHLLRTSYRNEEGKVQHKTVANLSDASNEEIAAIKLALKYKHNLHKLVEQNSDIQLQQGARYGAIFVLKQIAERLGIEKALGKSFEGILGLWQVIARVINQGSRLSSFRLIQSHAVKELLGLDDLKKDYFYDNLTWLADHQEEIEYTLWKQRCKKKGTTPNLFLYDVTSSYLEGDDNELAQYGYNRDKKKGKKQVVIGLLTDDEGCPIAVRVFEGNTQDPKTIASQIQILKNKFGIQEVTLVGDRGMIKGPQIDALPEGFTYITAITKPMMETLLQQKVIQISFLDEALHEVTHENIRYIVRKNPVRAKELAEKRSEKLEHVIKKMAERNKYLKEHPKAKVSVAQNNIQKVIDRLQISKWVKVNSNEASRVITLEKCEKELADLSFLDGVYVIKTNIQNPQIGTQKIHDRYKDLSKVESAFRTIKTGHLELRPIYVRKNKRTKGHVFVVMLAYMIVQELEKLWENLGIPVAEGIDELNSCTLMLMTKNNVPCVVIPKPSKSCLPLFESAGVEVPVALPMVRRCTHEPKKRKTK